MLTQAETLRRRCQAALTRHKKRAALVGVGLDYGLEDLVRAAQVQVRCAYCRLPLDFSFEWDHLVPTSRGGPHSLANLCCCCPECNQIKGSLTAAEFRQLLAFLAKLHPVAQHDILRRLRYGGRGYSKRGRGRA